MHRVLTVGVLALQGAFVEHLGLLKRAGEGLSDTYDGEWRFQEVRSPAELRLCDALIIPGGESTTMALVAARSGLLEPLRQFVKVERKPTWGTCAGLILLSEAANRTKKGGQDLIGGLDVKVDRNHFGRQNESFETDMDLPFLADGKPFRGIFIRAPIVERVFSQATDREQLEKQTEAVVTAPGNGPGVQDSPSIEILGVLPNSRGDQSATVDGTIVAVKQGHVLGTSFHPELTQDARIHMWWLRQVLESRGYIQG